MVAIGRTFKNVKTKQWLPSKNLEKLNNKKTMVATGRTFLPTSLRRSPVLSSLPCLSLNGKGDTGDTLVTDPSTFDHEVAMRNLNEIVVRPSFCPEYLRLLEAEKQSLPRWMSGSRGREIRVQKEARRRSS